MFWTGIHILEGCGGAKESTNVTFQVPEIRKLTGEEQKQVCKLALKTASNQFSIDREKTRCYVAEQTIAEAVEEDGSGRRLQTGMYDVSSMAVLNFDYTIPPNVVNVEEVKALAKAASATASGMSLKRPIVYSLSLRLLRWPFCTDFVVVGATPQSEAPSTSPSQMPSVSTLPSFSPSISTAPSDIPSERPSESPSITTQPSYSPSLSNKPSDRPSYVPSLTIMPSKASDPPSFSIVPSLTQVPTGRPTFRDDFGSPFLSADIGSVAIPGNSQQLDVGLYSVQGSGLDIWVSQFVQS